MSISKDTKEKEQGEGRADEPDTTMLIFMQGFFQMSPKDGGGERNQSITQSYSTLFSKKYIGLKI